MSEADITTIQTAADSAEVSAFYCLTIWSEEQDSGFRYLGEVTYAQARRMMSPEDFLLVPQKGVDTLLGIINDPAEAEKLFVFEVEATASDPNMTTGSWGLFTVDLPNMDSIGSQAEWEGFLKNKARYKNHLVLSGYDIDTAKRLFKILPASLGSVKH